jgi:hypothetical protein
VDDAGYRLMADGQNHWSDFVSALRRQVNFLDNQSR